MLPLILCRYCYTSTDACSIHADLFQTHTAVLWTALLLKKVEPGHAGDAAAGCGGFWGWSRGAVATVVRFHGIQELGGAVAVQAKSGGLWQGILCQWGAVTTQGILCQRGAVTTPGILCQRWAVTRHYVSEGGCDNSRHSVSVGSCDNSRHSVSVGGCNNSRHSVSEGGCNNSRHSVSEGGCNNSRHSVSEGGCNNSRHSVSEGGCDNSRHSVSEGGCNNSRHSVSEEGCDKAFCVRGGCDNKTFCVTGGLWHSILCHKVQPQPHTKYKLLLPITPLDIFETRVTSIAWQKWFTETCQIHGPT